VPTAEERDQVCFQVLLLSAVNDSLDTAGSKLHYTLYGQAEGKIIADIGQELRHQETRDFFSVARRLFLKI
jgi:hypothetical protein